MKAKIISREGKTRNGKGFSIKELEEVGLNIRQAKEKEIPVDKRRKSKYDSNVKTLKEVIGVK